MRQYILSLSLFFASACIVHGQIDTLKKIEHRLSISRNDTSRVMALVDYCNYYKYKRPDSALIYGYKAWSLARKIKYAKGEADALTCIVLTHIAIGNETNALKIDLEGLKIAENNKLSSEGAGFLIIMGEIYNRTLNYQKALISLKQSMNISRSKGYNSSIALSQAFMGYSYMMLNQLDSALYYCQLADNNPLKASWVSSYTNLYLGKVLSKTGKYDLALLHYKKCLQISHEARDHSDANLSIAQLYKQMGMIDSSINYAKKSLDCGSGAAFYTNIIQSYTFLSNLFENLDIKKAYEYSKMTIVYKDSLNKIVQSSAMQNFADFDKQERQNEIDAAKSEYQYHLKTNAFLGSFFTLFVIVVLLYRNNRLKQRAKLNIEHAFSQLKSTQAQLIQSEKMASLGQLISGIAHEINTPLGAIKASVGTIIDSSFQSLKQLPELVKKLKETEFALFLELVNRSVQSNKHITSREEREHRKTLADQLRDHKIENADNYADLLVDMAIYDNIEPYLPIINEQNMQAAFHLSQQMKNSQNIKTAVERASKIVFALKNYARSGNREEMVFADIPQTIETVLTLYHNHLKLGINVVKEFEDVPQILCYPDELNQVWTNLIYNAVQAMDGKGELTISVSKSQAGFENQSGLVIRITDTGKGITPEIKDKIFDAFYTTKAAGEGSGLGLYIVKQIIDKHKGRIWMESEVGTGTTFILELPVIK
jgi:two-component system, NtrC family, sensor kinase